MEIVCLYCEANITIPTAAVTKGISVCTNCYNILEIIQGEVIRSKQNIVAAKKIDYNDWLYNTFSYEEVTYIITGGILAQEDEGGLVILTVLEQNTINFKQIVIQDYHWYFLKNTDSVAIEKVNFTGSSNPGQTCKVNNVNFALLLNNFKLGHPKYFGFNLINEFATNNISEFNYNCNLYWRLSGIKNNRFLLLQPIEVLKLKIQQPISYFTDVSIVSCGYCMQETKVPNAKIFKSFVCTSCKKINSVDDTDKQIVQAGFIENFSHISFLAIGEIITIHGIAYTVLGYTLKKDIFDSYWVEHTIFNAIIGYAYLAEYKGNYTLLQVDKLAPSTHFNQTSSRIDRVVYNDDNINFQLFNKYEATIVYANGVFVGNPFNESYTTAIEYINPPIMWAYEKPNNEGITIFKAIHVNQKEIVRANLNNLPYKQGIGQLQPNPLGLKKNYIILTCIATFILIITTHLITMVNTKSILYPPIEYTFNAVDTNSYIIDDVEMPNIYNTLNLKINNNLINSWVEYDVDLIPQGGTNNTDIEGNIGAEYYTGYAEGEYWKEGSPNVDGFIYHIPKGTYQLKIKPTLDVSSNNLLYCTITLGVNQSQSRNLLISALMLVLGGGILLALYLYWEDIRWQNSPYHYINE